MEIANTMITTLSATENQAPRSADENAKGAKKKTSEEGAFDGALVAASLVDLRSALPENKAVQAEAPVEPSALVELSTKKAVQGSAGEEGKGRDPFGPSVMSLFQAQAEKNASSKMAGGFVAGPDQPWNSRWVFGPGMQPVAENSQPANLGEKLVSEIDRLKDRIAEQAQGGDELQLKQAAESTAKDIDSLIRSVGAEIEGVQSSRPEQSSKQGLKSLGGAEYLATLQGARSNEGRSSLSGDSSSSGEGRFGEPKDGARSLGGVAGRREGRGSQESHPFKLIPGGAEQSDRLQGGLTLAREESLSGMSTDSFLGAVPLSTAMRSVDSNGPPPPLAVTGHVVPGSMMRERLSSESVRNMSNGIASMAPNGGGEMRIRMNPGNLGELMIQVSTNGKDVGLKVKTTDSAAKKVIEESLGALRDSLAQQSLSLGRVDVTLASQNASMMDSGNGGEFNPSGSGFGAQAGLQDGSDRESRGETSFDREGSQSLSAASRSGRSSSAHGVRALAGSMSPASGSNRLDVMA